MSVHGCAWMLIELFGSSTVRSRETRKVVEVIVVILFAEVGT
jgi:hypothetical protein